MDGCMDKDEKFKCIEMPFSIDFHENILKVIEMCFCIVFFFSFGLSVMTKICP